MMKRRYNIWMEPESMKQLLRRASEAGFDGKGGLSRYLERIAKQPICFLDDNVRMLVEGLHLKIG